MAKLPEIEDRVVLDIYEAAIKHRYTKGKRRYLGMSAIGAPCERSLWFGFRGFTPAPMDGRALLIFELGDHVEEILFQWLERAGYRITERQREFRAYNGFFRGHWDGQIEGVTSRPHVWDAKSCNDAKFKSFKRDGMQKVSPQYYAQAQVYMHMSGLDRAIFSFYNKNTSEVWNERVHYCKPDADDLMDKAFRVITANEPLDGAFEEGSGECGWCDYRLFCRLEEGIVMSDDKTCGSCWYQWWKGIVPCCLHPDHPYVLEQWGEFCSDWSYLFDKEVGPHKLNRKPKVDVGMVKSNAL